MGKLDVFIVSGQLGLQDAGIYSIAFYIAIIVEIPYRSLLAISLPEISQSIKDKDIAYTNTLCRRISLHQFLTACFIFYLYGLILTLYLNYYPTENICLRQMGSVFIGLSRLIDSSFSVSLSVLNFSKYYYYSLLFTFALVG